MSHYYDHSQCAYLSVTSNIVSTTLLQDTEVLNEVILLCTYKVHIVCYQSHMIQRQVHER